MKPQSYSPEKAILEIQDRLRHLRKDRLKIEASQGLFLSFSFFIGSLLILFPLDSLIYLPPFIFHFSFLIFISSLCWFVGKPLLLSSSLVRIALEVERFYPHLKNRLVGALQLWEPKNRFGREGYSQELIGGTCIEALGLLKEINLTPLMDRRNLERSHRITSRLLLLGFAYAAFLPSPFHDTISKFIFQTSVPQRILLKVTPGDVEIPRGSSLLIEAKTYGDKPVSVEVSRGKEFIEDLAMNKDPLKTNLYRLEIPKVEKGFEYEIVARSTKHEARSSVYRVEVYDPPEVTHLHLKYIYPSYTHLEPFEVDGGGEITGLVGTEVLLEGKSNNLLKDVLLSIQIGESSDEKILPMSFEGKEFTGHLTIQRDGRYRILLTDNLGRENDPPRHRITAIPDEVPSVRIIEPGMDTDITQSMLLPLRISFVDDFGLTKASIVYKKGEGKEGRMEIANFKGRTGTEEVVYEWDLIPLGLLPGDILSYWAEVYDNDTYSGPKRATSSIYHLRYPTLEEIYREVAMEQGEMAEGIEERILPAQEELKEQLDRLSKELMTEKNLSWEEEKSLEMAISRQREIAKELRSLSETIERRLEEMKEGLVVDRETLEMMREIGRLLREVETEEMREAMKRLEEAIQSLKPEDIERAMKELTLNQEELKKRLERTLEVLKRMKQEQEMKALVEKAKEIEERQKELNKKTEDAQGKELENLQGEEEALQREVEELKKRMEDLALELKESDQDVSKDLETLSEEMERGNLSGMMSESASQLSKGNKPSSLQKGISNQLKNLSQGLSKAQEKMMSKRREEVLQAIRKAQEDLLTLSTREEELASLIRGGNEARDPFDLAETQEALKEGVKKVADQLYETGKKSFFIPPEVGKSLGQCLNNMGKTSEGLQGGQISQAGAAANEAMASLNETVKDLMEAYNQACQSSSSTGLEEAMQKLSACSSGQMQINEGTQGLLPLDIQGGQLSMEARAQMARLAAEQRALSERLQGVSEGIGERSDLLGDLEKLAEEMRGVAKELEERRVNENLVERQKRILSRLLDAQRSLHERDYSQRRKAEVGENYQGLEGPSSLPRDLGERRKTLREDLLKALKEGYPQEYETLIKAYFRSLSETEIPLE